MLDVSELAIAKQKAQIRQIWGEAAGKSVAPVLEQEPPQSRQMTMAEAMAADRQAREIKGALPAGAVDRARNWMRRFHTPLELHSAVAKLLERAGELEETEDAKR